MTPRIERLRGVPVRTNVTLEDYVNRSKEVSYAFGDGTVARDTERELEGMDKMARFVVQTFDLTHDEEEMIIQFLDNRRQGLNEIHEESSARKTEELHDFDDD